MPEDIKVYSISKVNQGFDARKAGSWREYEYLLPAKMIGSSSEDWELTLKKFDSVLKRYEGSQSFHNFHRVRRKELLRRGRSLPAKGKEEEDSDSDDVDVDEDVDEDELEDESEMVETISPTKTPTSSSTPSTPLSTLSSTPFVRESLFNKWCPEERHIVPKTRCNIYCCEVVDTFDIADIITDADSKFNFTGDLSRKIVRVRIRGQSFLLHQIRLMIGAAVMVTRGILPELAQECALVAPYFIPFPLAPAEGLILQDAGFGLNTNGQHVAISSVSSDVGDFVLLPQNKNEETLDFLKNKIYPKIIQDWFEQKERETSEMKHADSNSVSFSQQASVSRIYQRKLSAHSALNQH